MNTPLFSVLIANYNNGAYLSDAIECVLRQTYKHWEIVIVDDKSTDDSASIYEKYGCHKNIHVYYNDTNRGCGYSKRKCVEMASGEICAFLDPDDALTEDALETMVKAYDDENVTFAYSRYYECDIDMKAVKISATQRELPCGTSFLEYGKGAISHFYTFKRKDYLRTPGINAYGLRSVDHDLYYLMEEVGLGVFVDKPLYYYRTNTGNNISLGNNDSKAYYWDLIAMTNAYMRRGLSVEEKIFPILDEMIASSADAVLRSKTYRIGELFLRPFKYFKK